MRCLAKRQSWLCLIFLFISLTGFSQELKYKFGDLDPLDLTMKEYVLDKNVGAIKLLSYGHTFFDEGSRQMKFVVHERIKVFTSDGFSMANLIVRFRQSVKIKGFKGAVYNVKTNGDIEETIVDNGDLIKEKVNDESRSIKLAFPKVKEGSIIEYTYTVIITKGARILPWYFQGFVPVRHSEFLVEYPEFASYEVMLQNGQYINYITKPKKGQQLFLAKSLPAMPQESFVGNVDDFRCAVVHEVKAVSDNFSGGAYHRVYEDWSGLNADLMLHDDFGKRLSQMKFLKKEVPSFGRGLSEVEKVKLVRNKVLNQMSWNGEENLPMGSMREVWNKGLGEAQEINMLFIGLLRQAGLKANPVIISTWDNGLVNLEHAFVNQFNYVLALVEIDDKEVLVDAVYKNHPIGKLPGRLINKRGLMITKDVPRWIDLNVNGEKEIAVYSAMIDFDEEMNMSGTLTIIENGLTAFRSRKQLRTMSAKQRRQYFQEAYPGISVESVELDEPGFSTKAFKTIVSFTRESDEAVGKVSFLNPFIFQGIQKTPFKDKERYSPIDFNVPVIKKWVYTINFPDSMEIKELPEAKALSLPKNGARFVYNVSADKNKLTALINFNINTVFYSADDYSYLRDFYDKIISTQDGVFRVERR